MGSCLKEQSAAGDPVAALDGQRAKLQERRGLCRHSTKLARSCHGLGGVPGGISLPAHDAIEVRDTDGRLDDLRASVGALQPGQDLQTDIEGIEGSLDEHQRIAYGPKRACMGCPAASVI